MNNRDNTIRVKLTKLKKVFTGLGEKSYQIIRMGPNIRGPKVTLKPLFMSGHEYQMSSILIAWVLIISMTCMMN